MQLFEPLPCPACQGRKGRVWPLMRSGEYYYECTNPDCHMSGPLADTESLAVRAWNDLPRKDS